MRIIFSFCAGASKKFTSIYEFLRLSASYPDNSRPTRAQQRALWTVLWKERSSFFDEADVSLIHRTFRISYELLPDWIRRLKENQSFNVSVRFLSATLREERSKQLSTTYELPESEVVVQRVEGLFDPITAFKFLVRPISPDSSPKTSHLRKKEHNFRTNEIFFLCRNTVMVRFSSCIYANTKRDRDVICRDLEKLFTGDDHLRTYTVHCHYTGIDPDDLRKTEDIILDLSMDGKAVVVVATLGLGVGFDFTRIGLLVHCQCPSSTSRLCQDGEVLEEGIRCLNLVCVSTQRMKLNHSRG